jgi:excisionase family DNA binding protein
MDDLLTTAEAAEYLRTTVATLNTWRCTKAVKIPYYRIGRKILYRLSELQKYIDKQKVGG